MVTHVKTMARSSPRRTLQNVKPHESGLSKAKRNYLLVQNSLRINREMLQN